MQDITTQEIPYGYCHCGCGQKTTIAKESSTRRSVRKGEPYRYISGHNRLKSPLVTRFWQKVDRRSPNDCWLWTGGMHASGYGSGCTDKNSEEQILAHRLSWQLHFGSIPDGLFVCHHCDNRPCVNPAHLFLGTPADNTRDMVQKNRQVQGESTRTAKLTISQVAEIRSRFANGETQTDIARNYNVSKSCIYLIVRSKNWKSVK